MAAIAITDLPREWLGEGAVADAEDLVAGCKRGHVRCDLLDHAGEL